MPKSFDFAVFKVLENNKELQNRYSRRDVSLDLLTYLIHSISIQCLSQ